ncbi:Remorin, C-terminal [Artemisia annua]|uniref:Remorin, C-terminal n=1 Tax=Artemisia annua TaxID=35608 RepID=A0A2U1P9S7_ARTAN|nr:Remorin, C-terminal [Artemisia annua]
MSTYQGVASTNTEEQNPNGDESLIRDIHALTPSSILPQPNHYTLRSSLSMDTSDSFSNMSADNSTLVVAGSVIGSLGVENEGGNNHVNDEDYDQVDGMLHPSLSPVRRNGREMSVPLRNVKKEEVESKIIAWKNAKIAEITNRFKCEDAIIKGWESEQVQKATLKMKKVERKLEEKKARAMEKMENDIAKAHQKAEERRASAESIRGTKMARVLEVANLMKAVGRSPVKSFF